MKNYLFSKRKIFILSFPSISPNLYSGLIIRKGEFFFPKIMVRKFGKNQFTPHHTEKMNDRLFPEIKAEKL